MASTTEQPRYSLVETLDQVEIRQYEPMILATTTTNSGDGFQRLANFIFGGNETGERIAMTAPVANSLTEDGWQTAFMMPSRYQLEELPQPKSSRVNFVQIPARVMAVVSFPGWANREAVAQHHSILLTTLAKHGLEPVGQPIINQYDDPWTPAAERTNEIQYQLSGLPDRQGTPE